MRTRRRHSGFSLTELIVAIALFSVLSLAIFAVFVSSMRAVRTANQAMEANEMVRGAFNVLQRDLTTAFTSRDAGEHYQFFGAPWGMMFVGLVQDNGVMRLARVTYVIRPTVYDPAVDAYQAESIVAAEYDPTVDPDEEDPMSDVPTDTYSLVRFVEIDVEDLDTFPGAIWSRWEDPSDEYYRVPVRNELEEVRDYAALNGLSAEDTEVLLSAKKRELWLRMLSGTERGVLPDGLPDAWEYLRADLNAEAVLAPVEYVLMENIVARDPDKDRLVPDHYFGMLTSNEDLWDDPATLVDPGNPPDGYWRREPEGTEAVFYYDLRERPFFEYGRVGVGLHSAAAADEIYAAATGDLYSDWNTFSNFENPVFFIDREDDPLDPALEPLGDPLRPRLPEIVQVHLAVRFESPYVGARDYVRELDQTIDIPSGYTRADLTTDRRDPTAGP
ncbi:MAG: prepilin-type N-terminal cleavage/methylation domain-containing protein [bacterium]|nr:prepilin-type N-terminal cleavage/methylation domain-containing protein [bacterium]